MIKNKNMDQKQDATEEPPEKQKNDKEDRAKSKHYYLKEQA